MFKLYCFIGLGYLLSTIAGFDGSLMGGINGIPSYLKTFHIQQASVGTGIVFMITNIGTLAAFPLVGPISDGLGRRWSMFIGSLIIIAGTAVQCSANAMPQFIGGRFLLGLGGTIAGAVAPAYVVEWCHPLWRGTQGGLYNVCWYLGSIVAGMACYGTNLHMKDSSWAWRLPVLLQCVMPGIVAAGILFCPESPRWLIAHDRHEEAHRLLIKYHGEGDPASIIVQMEYEEMCEQIKSGNDGSDKRWWDYREIFNSPNARYRLYMVVGMAFFGQWTGNNVISYFIVIMFKQAGITNPNTQLLLNALNPVFSMLASIAGAMTLDKFGRRKILLFSTIASLLCISVVTACTAVASPGNGASYGVVVFIFLFGVLFSYGYTPLQALYPVECLNTQTRAKGVAVSNVCMAIAGVYNTFAPPVAMSRIGWRWYFFYIIWDIFEIVIIYFFFVETAGRTLEELDEAFSAKNPVKASLRKPTVLDDEDQQTQKDSQ